MTDFHLTTAVLFALWPVAWLSTGALIGAAYFLTLRWSVGLLVFGRAPLVAATMQVGRFLLLASFLIAVAYCCGALSLIAAAAGILGVRTMMTTRLAALT